MNKIHHSKKYMSPIILILPLLFAGCTNREEIPKVILSETETAVENEAKPVSVPIRIAISAIASPRKNIMDYESILWYVGHKLGRPVEIVQRETYAECISLLENREVDVAFVCSGPYVVCRERFGAELLAVPQIRGKTIYQSYIIVHKKSPIQRFEDLRGKTFAFTDPLSTTGKMYPTYLILKKGELPNAYFRNTIFTKGHDNSVKAVADNLVDGAAVDQLIWEDLSRTKPEIARQTRIILKSPPFGMPPVIIHPAINDRFKAEMRRIFLSMHKDEEGRKLLKKSGIERFVLQDDSAYDSIRQMRSEVLRLTRIYQ